MAVKVSHLVQNWMQTSVGDAAAPADLASLPLMAEASGSDSHAATAGASLLGNNDSDPNAEGVAIYTDPKNLGTAFSSIMNHAQTRANFHPANTDPDKLGAAFSAYVVQVDETPFFHLMKSNQDKQSMESSDYNKLIDQIVHLYDGLQQKDIDKMKTAITDMAKSVFSESHSQRWKNLFAQTTLDMTDPKSPRFFLYYTSLYMSRDDNGKAGTEEKQTYEVRKTEYVLLPDLIKAHAETLAKLDKKSVDDWMNESTTPKREDAKLCFTPK